MYYGNEKNNFDYKWIVIKIKILYNNNRKENTYLIWGEILMKKIIIYDFDGTLTPFSLPKFEILEKCGMKDGAHNPQFLELAKKELKMKILTYIQLYMKSISKQLEVLGSD